MNILVHFVGTTDFILDIHYIASIILSAYRNMYMADVLIWVTIVLILWGHDVILRMIDSRASILFNI